MRYLVPLIIWSVLYWSCSKIDRDQASLSLSNGKVVRVENFKSKFVPQRNIDIWLPDNYSTNKEYAVLYMHDGQMLFDTTNSWNKQEWGVDETIHQLWKTKEIRNTIVVGIWNTEFRHSEYFPQKPFENLTTEFQKALLDIGVQNQGAPLFKTEIYSDNYLKFIVEELKPFIDNKYSTKSDMKNTFIAGSSMGGLISLYAICEYPEIFYGAACLSTHWVGIFDTLNNPIPISFVEYLEDNLPSAQNHLLYFDYGTETLDALYEPYQLMIDSVLTRSHYTIHNWKTLKFEGEDHSEKAWNKRLHIPIKFLLNNENEINKNQDM